MDKPRPTAGRSSGPEIRALSRSLAEAQDVQLARVVAMVDALPNRGPADALIDPLRPRLIRLRPVRPLNFTRLLFMPIDPVIVAAPLWRPGLATVPRSVLRAIAATVRAGLGPEAAAIDAVILGHGLHEAAVLAEAGRRAWPLAARILSEAPAPVAWEETGLNRIVYPPLARRIGLVLTELPALDELVAESDSGIAAPRPAPIAAMVRRVASQLPDALPTLLAVLLARLPLAATLLPGVATSLGPPIEALLQGAAEQAVDLLLLRLEAAHGADVPLAPGGDLGLSAIEVRRIATLLRGLGAAGAQPERQERLKAIRQRLDQTCRIRFTHGLASNFLAPLQSLAQGPDDDTAAHLETTARHLRELETEARAIGGAEIYDALLIKAGAAVNAGNVMLSLADRVRLVEILRGPEAALAMLEEAEAARQAG